MNKLKAALLLLAGAFCFSTTGVFQSIAPQEASPWVVSEARLSIGCFSLFLWCLCTGKLPNNWKELPWKYIFLCVCCIVSYSPLFFFSVKAVGVSTTAVVAIGVTPLWTAIIERILYRSSPPIQWYIATFLAIAGIVHMNSETFASGGSLLYCFLPIAAGFVYAVLLVFTPKVMKVIPAETTMMIVMGISSLIMIPVLFIYPFNWIFTMKGSLVVLGIGFISVGLAFSLFMTGLQQTGSVIGATLGLAEPIGAALLGILLLNEPVSRLQVGGLHLLFASIILLVLGQIALSDLFPNYKQSKVYRLVKSWRSINENR